MPERPTARLRRGGDTFARQRDRAERGRPSEPFNVEVAVAAHRSANPVGAVRGWHNAHVLAVVLDAHASHDDLAAAHQLTGTVEVEIAPGGLRPDEAMKTVGARLERGRYDAAHEPLDDAADVTLNAQWVARRRRFLGRRCPRRPDHSNGHRFTIGCLSGRNVAVAETRWATAGGACVQRDALLRNSLSESSAARASLGPGCV
jgi:hypothetical protein